jgi:hypothetical protein
VNPHLEVLEPGQDAVLRRVAGPLAAEGFYLGGGTAIALHLGHRKSVDLDWFTAERVEDPRRLVGRLRDQGVVVEDAQTQRGTVHGAVDGVRVSLLEFRYALLAPVERFDDVPIASLDDLAPMKLSAIAQRGTRRDFVDIHALVQGFRPLPEMLELYRRKFEVEDLTHVVYGLGYFDDAEPEQMPTMLRDADWETIKTDLRAWLREL